MRIKGLPIVRSGFLLPIRAEDTGTTSGGTPDAPAEDGSIADLVVRFSPFDTWYEINSFWEGRFLERTMPGTFKNTINAARRSDGMFSTKVLFNHGMDLNIGDKMLGVPRSFAEVNQDGYHGPQLDVPMFDTSYNRDLIPGLRAGAYGSSFMFETIREEWNNEPGTSDHNPEGLPERTLQEARTFEAGPVTWPASPTATSGLRSLAGTDKWMERVQARSGARFDDLVRSFEAFRAMYKTPDFREVTPTPDAPASRRQDEQEIEAKELRLRELKLTLMRR